MAALKETNVWARWMSQVKVVSSWSKRKALLRAGGRRGAALEITTDTREIIDREVCRDREAWAWAKWVRKSGLE